MESPAFKLRRLGLWALILPTLFVRMVFSRIRRTNDQNLPCVSSSSQILVTDMKRYKTTQVPPKEKKPLKENCIIEQRDGDSCCYLLFALFVSLFFSKDSSAVYKMGTFRDITGEQKEKTQVSVFGVFCPRLPWLKPPSPPLLSVEKIFYSTLNDTAVWMGGWTIVFFLCTIFYTV